MSSARFPQRSAQTLLRRLASAVAIVLSFACGGKSPSAPTAAATTTVPTTTTTSTPAVTAASFNIDLAKQVANSTFDALQEVKRLLCKAEFPNLPCNGFFSGGPLTPQGVTGLAFEATRGCSGGGSTRISNIQDGLHYYLPMTAQNWPVTYTDCSFTVGAERGVVSGTMGLSGNFDPIVDGRTDLRTTGTVDVSLRGQVVRSVAIDGRMPAAGTFNGSIGGIATAVTPTTPPTAGTPTTTTTTAPTASSCTHVGSDACGGRTQMQIDASAFVATLGSSEVRTFDLFSVVEGDSNPLRCQVQTTLRFSRSEPGVSLSRLGDPSGNLIITIRPREAASASKSWTINPRNCAQVVRYP